MADVEFKFPDEQAVDTKGKDKEPEDSFEIEVQDDTPEKDRGYRKLEAPVADPTEDELEQYGEGVKKRIKELTHARHDERRAKELFQREKEEAVNIAKRTLEENKRLQQKISQRETSYVSQEQRLAEVELGIAKASWKSAHESGDTDLLAEATTGLHTAQSRLREVQSFKPAPLPKEEISDTVQPQTQQQPVQVDQKAQAWRDKNSWFGEDEEMTSLALGLHNKLVKAGYNTASDEYYDAINTRMKQIFPQQFPEDSKESTAKKPATVVAPSSRASSAKKIVLTQSAVTLAKRLGLPLEVYAKQVAADLRKQNG